MPKIALLRCGPVCRGAGGGGRGHGAGGEGAACPWRAAWWRGRVGGVTGRGAGPGPWARPNSPPIGWRRPADSCRAMPALCPQGLRTLRPSVTPSYARAVAAPSRAVPRHHRCSLKLFRRFLFEGTLRPPGRCVCACVRALLPWRIGARSTAPRRSKRTQIAAGTAWPAHPGPRDPAGRVAMAQPRRSPGVAPPRGRSDSLTTLAPLAACALRL